MIDDFVGISDLSQGLAFVTLLPTRFLAGPFAVSAPLAVHRKAEGGDLAYVQLDREPDEDVYDRFTSARGRR